MQRRTKVARPLRFELTTPCSGGMYSIHLSYVRAEKCVANLWPRLYRPSAKPFVSCDSSRYFPIITASRISVTRSEEHTSELQSHSDLVCRLLLEKKKNINERVLLSGLALCALGT